MTGVDGPCAVRPRPGEVHQDRNATIYVMAVLRVPGQVPIIESTPTYACDAGTGDPAGKLIAAVPGAAERLVAELKKRIAHAPEKP